MIGIVINTSAFAQYDSSNKKMSPPDIKYDSNDSMNQNQDNYNKTKPDPKLNPDSSIKDQSLENRPDVIKMTGGRMWIVRNNKLSELDKTFTLSNGIKIYSDGSYVNKEGIKKMFKEGEHMDMSGKIIPMK